ncbi:MAG: hypothetical protein J6S49_06750 [Erysipelotrichaceae bacterium]|nr:hypothetical protein [Erysipelotrichaceae bacterium]
MSRQFNTDGLMVFPPDNEEPITLNAFESIECAIAFDVRDWSEDRRSAWIYAIVFGWDYEDSWYEIAKKFDWDEEDRKRANMMREQWIKAKETKEQPEIVRCNDCKWYDERISLCDNCGLPREQTFFCADGKRRFDDA